MWGRSLKPEKNLRFAQGIHLQMYVCLDKGYDVEPIHEIIYKSYGIIPIIVR